MSCEIRVYDNGFNWLAEINTAESVQFTRNVYGGGGAEIRINPAKPGADSLLRRDNIIMINRDPRKCAVIEDFSISRKTAAESVIYASCPIKSFAGRRITVPPDNPAFQGFDRVSGPGESVVKHYIRRHLAEPEDPSRRINITVAGDLARGETFPWQSRYKNLFEELSDIGEFSGLGMELYADLNARRWVFDVYTGKDTEAVFKTEYQNLSEYRYLDDRSNYRGTGYAGGRGENENRLIYALGAEKAGLERYECFLDCPNAANIDELKYYGAQKLSAFREVKSLEAQALPNRVFVFGKDYDLGDRVKLMLTEPGLSAVTRVTEAREIFEPGRDAAEIRLGGKPVSVFELFAGKGTAVI